MFRFSETVYTPKLSPPNLLFSLYEAFLPTEQLAPGGMLGMLSDRIGTGKELRDKGISYATEDNYTEILESVYGPFTATAWLVKYINYVWQELLKLPLQNSLSEALKPVAGYGDGNFIVGHPAAILCLQLLLKSMHRPTPVRSIVGIKNLDWTITSSRQGLYEFPYIDFRVDFMQKLAQIHSGNIVGMTHFLNPVIEALDKAGILGNYVPIKDLWWGIEETSGEIPAIDQVTGRLEPTITCVIADDAEHELTRRLTDLLSGAHIDYQLCIDRFKDWQWLTIFAGEYKSILREYLIAATNHYLDLGNPSLVGISAGNSVVPHLEGFELTSFDPVASIRMKQQIMAMRSERPLSAKGLLYVCEEP